MSTYNPKHFTDADVLRTIEPKRLIQLLNPYADYLDDRGLSLPSARKAATLDVDRLADVLETSSETGPQDLLNAIGYIDEMATTEGMDALLPIAIKAGMSFDATADHSPADIAVQVWLFDPMIVQREHIWHTWRPPRRVDCFRPDTILPDELFDLTDARIKQAEADIGDWLGANNRTKYCVISHRQTDNGHEFSIQRGDPFTRKPTLEESSIRNIHYRPAGKDKVVFLMEDQELQINSPIRRAIPIYQRIFGRLLFDDPEYFSDTDIVSLRPIEELGAGVLECSDIAAIEEITLVEYCVDLSREHNASITYRATDIVAFLEYQQSELSFEGRLASVTFRIKYRGSRGMRTLKLYAGNATCYTRDGNSQHAEHWMRVRNFIKERGVKSSNDLEESQPSPKTAMPAFDPTVGNSDSALADA